MFKGKIKTELEELMDNLVRSHLGPGGKESHQYIYIYLSKVELEELMDKLTRSHMGPGGKESHQYIYI